MAELIIRNLGLQPYEPVWRQMQVFTQQRTDTTPDEIWMLEHQAVFTQGQAGKAEHLLKTGDIPVVQVDRGGQVTYHGPGQLVIYLLLDLKRKGVGVRELVTLMENAVITLLAGLGVEARARADAPGVYVKQTKIASLGLRVRRGCSFHGLALNLNMDMTPFLCINPCGYAGMEMTQLSDHVADLDQRAVADKLLDYLTNKLGYTDFSYFTALDTNDYGKPR